MLFFESFRIYGLETNKKALYDSCDIVTQNLFEDITSIRKFKDMIIFGYYAGWYFCYDKIKLDLI